MIKSKLHIMVKKMTVMQSRKEALKIEATLAHRAGLPHSNVAATYKWTGRQIPCHEGSGRQALLVCS